MWGPQQAFSCSSWED